MVSFFPNRMKNVCLIKNSCSDIRKQEEVLQESYMMIPDSKNRFDRAKEELESLVGQCEDEPDIDGEVLAEARSLLA